VCAFNGLAFTAWQSWAFRRAELTAFAESPYRCATGKRATMAPIRTLHPRASGIERMIPVGRVLFSQLHGELLQMPAETRVGLVLTLPSRMGDGGDRIFRAQREVLEHELVGSLLETHAARGDRWLSVRMLPLGQAGFAQALTEAADAIERDRIDVAIVGGIDSGLDPLVVERLLIEERLYDGENLDSVIPGEGGAFALVTRREVARQCGWTERAALSAVAIGHEPSTRDNDVPCMALGLSRAALEASAALRDAKRSLDWWISDMNAEDRRVHEFQLAWPRVAAGLMAPTAALDFLPMHFGELGAATMPTALAVAVEGMRRGSPVARTCLITGSDDDGARGVVLLESA
jgi:3-oxoacyl-[acyl-carrier-protein] synthase-1